MFNIIEIAHKIRKEAAKVTVDKVEDRLMTFLKISNLFLRVFGGPLVASEVFLGLRWLNYR